MGKFKQKINEQSVVMPSGFTGVIVDNSKIVIDKSYVEKGTSFINAFNNSNVILRDCATPEPTSDSNENIVLKVTSKLESEIDRKTLPFWVHHNIARFDNVNTAVNDNNKSLIRLEVINDYDMQDEKYKKILDFRTTIENNLFSNDLNETVVEGKYMLEQQILRDNKLSDNTTFSTKDIDYTKKGLYYLSGVTSSIKAVWPLTSISKTNIDNPKLNLNFIDREIFPYTTLNNILVKVNNVNKLDSYGNEIDVEGAITYSRSPNTFKHIVSSKLNKPLFNLDGNNEKIPTKLEKDVNGFFIKVENFVKEGQVEGQYYFSGPYLNDLNYISYTKNDKVTNSKLLQNDVAGEDETRFYVKLNYNNNEEVLDLFELMNQKIDEGEVESNNVSSYFKKYYFNDKIDKNNGKLYLDYFSIESSDFNSENFKETCNFYGFKFNNGENLIKIDPENREYFLDENGNNITDEVLRGDTSSNSLAISGADILSYLDKFYLSGPDSTSIQLKHDENECLMLIDEDNVYKKINTESNGESTSEAVEINLISSDFWPSKFENNFTVKYENNEISLSAMLSSSTKSLKITNNIISGINSLYKNEIGKYDGYLLLRSSDIQDYIEYELSGIQMYLKSIDYEATKYSYDENMNIRYEITSDNKSITIYYQLPSSVLKSSTKKESAKVEFNSPTVHNNGINPNKGSLYILGKPYETSDEGETEESFISKLELSSILVKTGSNKYVFDLNENDESKNTDIINIFNEDLKGASGIFYKKNGNEGYIIESGILSSSIIEKNIFDNGFDFTNNNNIIFSGSITFNNIISDELSALTSDSILSSCKDSYGSISGDTIDKFFNAINGMIQNDDDETNLNKFKDSITGFELITPALDNSINISKISFYNDYEALNKFGIIRSSNYDTVRLSQYIYDQIKNSNTDSVYGSYNFKDELIKIFKKSIIYQLSEDNSNNSISVTNEVQSGVISSSFKYSDTINSDDAVQKAFENYVENNEKYIEWKEQVTKSVDYFDKFDFDKLEFNIISGVYVDVVDGDGDKELCR